MWSSIPPDPEDPLPPGPFPFEAISDLRGITRVLYATVKRDVVGHLELLKKITATGKKLTRSLEFAMKARTPKELERAHRLAAAATREVGQYVVMLTLQDVIEVAQARVLPIEFELTDRERKRRARYRR